jgi:hypothetical protein
MASAAVTMPNDPKPFKAEWEALEIVEHYWVLEGIEKHLRHQRLF